MQWTTYYGQCQLTAHKRGSYKDVVLLKHKGGEDGTNFTEEGSRHEIIWAKARDHFQITFMQEVVNAKEFEWQLH